MAMSGKKLAQAFGISKETHPWFLMSTCGRSPLRARNTIDCFGAAWELAEQPQWVSRWKLNLRGRRRLHNNAAAAIHTITNDTSCCQSMIGKITRKTLRANGIFNQIVLVLVLVLVLERSAGNRGRLPAFLDFETAIAVPKLRRVAAVFRHAHRVTYAECTLGNHVYYSRYLDLLEAARGEFFRQLGATFQQWQEQDAIFPVVECRLRYKSPARYDDVLSIEVRPA